MLDEWIREKAGSGSGSSFLHSKKGQFIIVILVCLGLLALIWPVSNVSDNTGKPVPEEQSELNYASDPCSRISYELESILSQIEGAGEVEVSISTVSSGRKTYATNLRTETRESNENDRQGINKSSVEENANQDIAVSSGNPLLVEEKNPEILGVLVVADGARSPEIREKLTNATATLLDIPVHKVEVMPRKGGKL